MKRDKDDKNNSTQHRSVSPKEFDVLVQSNERKKENMHVITIYYRGYDYAVPIRTQ